LNPFAPHISEELNEKLGYAPISGLQWPTYDDQLMSDDTITLAIQFNGKMRGSIEVAKDAQETLVLEMVEDTSFGEKYLKNGKIRKIIYVPGRIMNIIVS